MLVMHVDNAKCASPTRHISHYTPQGDRQFSYANIYVERYPLVQLVRQTTRNLLPLVPNFKYEIERLSNKLQNNNWSNFIGLHVHYNTSIFNKHVEIKLPYEFYI